MLAICSLAYDVKIQAGELYMVWKVRQKAGRGFRMKKSEYLKKTSLKESNEVERATLIAFYLYKTMDKSCFTMKELEAALIDFGQSRPNRSRLKKNLLQTEFFTEDSTHESLIRFTDIGLETLEDLQNELWTNDTVIVSKSELLDEEKFCGKRGFIDPLIHQINHSYAHNCYDAAAVLMRRLFEVLLILSYEANHISEEIKTKDGKNYITLDGIVANAKSNKVLNLGRVKQSFDVIKNTGNYSAHSIRYTASKKDIDAIRLDYRVAVEELFYKAKLI